MSQDPILDEQDELMELTDPLMRFKSITEHIVLRIKPLMCFTHGEDDDIQTACIILQFEFICLYLCRYLSTMILEGTTDPEAFLDIFFKGASLLLSQCRKQAAPLPLELLTLLEQQILLPLQKRTPLNHMIQKQEMIIDVLFRAKMWVDALMAMAVNKRIPKKMNRMIQSLEMLLIKTRQHHPSNENLLQKIDVLTISTTLKKTTTTPSSQVTTTLLQPRWEVTRHVFRAFFRIDNCYPSPVEKRKAWKTRYADVIFKMIILVFFHLEQVLQIFFWLNEENHDQKKTIMHRLFRRRIQRNFLLQKINIQYCLDEFIPTDVMPLFMNDVSQNPKDKEIKKKKERQGSELIYKQNMVYLEKELAVFDKGQSFLSFLFRQQKKHLFLVDVQNICRVSLHMKDNKKIDDFMKRPVIHRYLINLLFQQDEKNRYLSYATSSYWVLVNKGDVQRNPTTREITILSHEKGTDPDILHIRIACFDPVTEMDSFFTMGGDEMDDIFIVKVISDLHADSQRKRGGRGSGRFAFDGIHVLSHDLYSNFTGYTSLTKWSLLHHPSPLGKRERNNNNNFNTNNITSSSSLTTSTTSTTSTTGRSLLSRGLLRGQGRG